ncbi:hypothetical protein G7043_44010 [Lentzea sp. NEAU-D13]|uniref:SH3 domain-containing protein n=1 Tax=Lentzea alba TaxID=2714351 RepID=A0A7C9VZC4_9PSEU|nr:hypothetical protein [Lentzea alba]NGY65875.1 hypothetical protein [Lentzea alba]
MGTRLRKFGAGLAAFMLATTGASIFTASPAVAAVPCGPSAPDKDTRIAQTVNKDPRFPLGVQMRTGPGLNCDPIVRVPWEAWVDLNCFRRGDSVNGVTTWSAVRFAQHFGWISDYHLSGQGSNFNCG